MTRAQLKPFFRAVSRAASAQGLVGREAVERYRHEVMREEVGAASAGDVAPADGFDRVMYRLAVDAGDWSAAARYATGEERRMAHLVEQCARQVVELKAIESVPEAMFAADDPGETAVAYAVGCLRQSGLSVVQTADGWWWADISGSAAFSVFRMLDTHRRRLLRRLGWTGTLAFDDAASWATEDGGAIIAKRKVAATATAPIRAGRTPLH